MDSTNKKRIIKIIVIVAAIIAITVIGTLILNDIAFKHEEGLVYRTRTGDCYHTIGCGYLRSQIPMGIEQARSSTLRACSRCGGIPKGTIEVNNYPAAVAIVFLIEIVITIIGFVIYNKLHPEPATNTVTKNTGSYTTKPVSEIETERDRMIRNCKTQPIESIQWMKGKTVRHKRFGEGTITEINNEYICVRFEEIDEVKRFQYPQAIIDKFLEF